MSLTTKLITVSWNGIEGAEFRAPAGYLYAKDTKGDFFRLTVVDRGFDDPGTSTYRLPKPICRGWQAFAEYLISHL